MLLTKNILQRVSLTSFSVFLLFSCSKDADLLSEYVIADKNNLESIALLVDDSFFISNGQQNILLDVLNNDTFDADAQVKIVSTSLPKNGNVVINDNNTLTYTPQIATPTPVETTPAETTPEETPPAETPPVEDTFTYTTEVTTNESEVLRQEANVTISTAEMGELKAFPGAEGFGKYTTGGRGGTVIHVTNLNNSGPGSLREALQKTGPRTVVFDVGGTIELASSIDVGSGSNASINTSARNLTIAGETAPFPGISLHGGGLNINTSNVIVRYITIRLDVEEVEGPDALRIKSWGADGSKLENVIIDHCSFSHGSDENVDVNGASAGNTVENVTIQNCLLGENSQQQKNILTGFETFNITWTNNYLTESMDRNPLLGYGSNGETSEWINNIVYGYEGGMAISWGNNVDVLSNIYESFISNPNKYNVISLGSQGYNNAVNSGSVFVNNNFVSGPMESGSNAYNGELTTNNKSSRVITNSLISTWETVKVNIESKVLSNVGNSLYRDEMDTNWINSYYNKNGILGYTKPISLASSSRSGDFDTDQDGMSDSWERALFGDLTKTAQGDENGDGYTNIEVYLFSLLQ